MNRTELIMAVAAALFTVEEPDVTEEFTGDYYGDVQVVVVPSFFSKKEAKENATLVVNTVFGILTDSFVSGQPATISGFGKFTPCTQKNSKRINPRTGQAITVPDRRTVRFKASPILKEQLNGNRTD